VQERPEILPAPVHAIMEIVSFFPLPVNSIGLEDGIVDFDQMFCSLYGRLPFSNYTVHALSLLFI
jgi:hypothetical protein